MIYQDNHPLSTISQVLKTFSYFFVIIFGKYYTKLYFYKPISNTIANQQNRRGYFKRRFNNKASMKPEEICYHTPALLQESLDGLDIHPSGIYVDVTFGGGGHSREILKRLDKKGHLYSFDQDPDAEQNILEGSRFTFVRSNFRFLYHCMPYYG